MTEKKIIKDEIIDGYREVVYDDGTGYVEYIVKERDFNEESSMEVGVYSQHTLNNLELKEKVDYLTTLVELQGGLI